MLKQSHADRKLHQKMKQQNFHISGPDHDYLAPARNLESNASYSALPTSQDLILKSGLTSPTKPPRTPACLLSRDKSKQHYRTSFQEQFEISQVFGG